MKNNKGFTLVEMLSVLIILVTLTLLIIPTIGKYINEGKEKSYYAQLNMILVSTENYFNDIDNIDYLPRHTKNMVINSNLDKKQGQFLRELSLSLKTLQKKGIVPHNIKNPKTDNNLSSDYHVDIEYCGNQKWIYKIKENVTSNLYLVKTGECSKYGIIALGLKNWIISNANAYPLENHDYVVSISKLVPLYLDQDYLVKKDMHYKNIFIRKENSQFIFKIDNEKIEME